MTQRIRQMASQAQARHSDDDLVVVGPQPGFQTRFLSSRAHITIGGGAAFCGKSYAELLAPVKWVHIPDFRCTFFRRSMEEIRDQGGLWDESVKLYLPMGATPREQTCEWRWPLGAQIAMDHLQYDSTAYHKQGSQIALLIFDELTHFTKFQFWYLFGRNRSTCGIRPYTLASCNPDADSWVAELIAWWINQETGDPIPERSGVLRWFTRDGDDILWGNNRMEVLAQIHPGRASANDIKSLTFIPGSIDENVIGNTIDPGYRGNLMAMTRVERARLLDGNWKVRKSAGSYFRRSDVKMLDVAPTDLVAVTRRWDLAASEPTEAYPDPDWTCGVKLGRYKDGRFVVLHAEMQRKRANEVRELVKRLAMQDGVGCSIGVPQDPAQAGKDQAQSYVRDLAGFSVYAEKESGDKETRAEPCAAQWQHQNIDVVKGPWNEAFFAQLEAFPDSKVHDDAVDALSGAFQKLSAKGASIFDAVD
jgi:predicted phage terminase large subunit-like protein